MKCSRCSRRKRFSQRKPVKMVLSLKVALAVEIELGGPPGGRAVFELGPVGVEIIAAALRAEGGEVFDLEAAGFFEVVIVGDDVGALLRVSRDGVTEANANRPETRRGEA